MKKVKSNNTSKSIPQELLACPVCGKEFKPNDDTKYIVTGGHTCSWECFLTVVKRRTDNDKQSDV